MRALVLAGALALAACAPPGPPGGQHSGAATTTQGASQGKPGADQAVQTTPVVSTPVASTPGIDREFMIGRWGDNGDCSKDVVLNGDGSFTSYTGGEGQWSLQGATLRMAGKENTLDLQLELIDHDNLRITNPDGSVGTSQRCG
jgi:hypothetical protein